MPNRYMRASKLSDGTFEAIVLAFAEERPSSEVAQRTGVSVKTVKKLYQILANCLFGKTFHRYSKLAFWEDFEKFVESGKDGLTRMKSCILYCPAIINNDTGERGECHVCPRVVPYNRPPASDEGIARTLFLNRKFLAALEGYHLYARMNYFLVIAKMRDEESDDPEPEKTFASRLLNHFERNPIDLRVFESCWDGRVNLYYKHANNQRDVDPARPRSTLRRQE
jgi:hypothetical protein